MAEKKSDVLEPRFDGALIRNKYVKAGLFIVKTKAQRNEQIKTLYRELDGETTTLCYVSADRAIYELIANPSSEGTTDQDWEKLDFGVSDILIAKGNWEADNTNPVLSDAGATGNGNDFYVVTGAPTPVQYQDPSVFGGAEVTITNGDWVISNGEEWFTTGAPINWDAISGIPSVISDYIAGTVIVHGHEIDDINGLQAALDLKFDDNNVVEGDIDPATELDAALVNVLFLKTNYYSKSETYSQSEIDTMVGNNSPLSTKGDIYVHNGTLNARLPIGTDDQVLVADAAEALGMKWADAAETGWKTIGETVLTGAATITHNHNALIHDLGALEVSGFSMIADLDTSLGTNIFRFNHQALSDHSEGFTEIYFGSNNGNSGSEAWGNIMFGQNNANSLLATGEWAGGRNIIGGFENGDGFSSLSTHNVIFGRRNASGAGEVSYGVILGYEALNGATSTAPDGKQNVTAVGVWTMQNFAFNAEVGTEAYNSNIVAFGTEAGAEGLSIYDGGNSGTDRGGALDALLLGTRAAYGASIEKYEIIIGSSAGKDAVIGRGNILIGTLAGASMTGGLAGNTGIGETIYNTLVGTHTGEFLTGNKNSFFGTESGSSAVIGSYNAGFGNWALNRFTGDYNAAFGAYAGYNGVTPFTGDYNAFFGAGASYDSATPTFSNSIVLATNHTQLMESNKIYIGAITQNVIFNGVLTENNAETQLAVINSTTGELEYRTAESLANETAGIDGAIQYSESSLHAADDAFTFNSAKKWLNMDATGAHTAIPRWSLTMGDDINTIGAGSGSLAWSAIFGDVFVFDNAGTSRSISNILSTGTGNTITIANGAFGIYSSAFLGAELTIEPSLAGTNYQGSIIGGTYNTSRNGWQYVGGQRADVLGLGAFVHGQGENVNRLFSDGNWSINMSINTVASTFGEGANAANSAIIGGQDHHIPSDSLRSVIIGGNALKMPAATTDTVLVENLMVNGALTDIAGDPLIGDYITVLGNTQTFTNNDKILSPATEKNINLRTTNLNAFLNVNDRAAGGFLAIGNVMPAQTILYFDPNNSSGQGATGGVFFADTRVTTKGIEYKADYSSGFTALSLTDKGYGDSHIGGQLVDALIESPTASEDGFHIAWNDTNQEYELAAGAAPSTDYWKTVGTSTLTGSVVIDGGFNYNIEIANRTGTGRYVVLGSYDTGFDEIGIAVDGDNYLVRMGYSVDIISDPLAGTVDYGIEASGSYLKFFRGGSEVDFLATSGSTIATSVDITTTTSLKIRSNAVVPTFTGFTVEPSQVSIWGGSNATSYATASKGIIITPASIEVKGVPINYTTDLSGSFVALSLIDKGYADAAYFSLDSTNQALTGATQKVITIPDGAYIDFTAADDLTIFFVGGSKLSTGKGITMESNALGTATDWARLAVQSGNITLTDNKASKRGLEYAAAGYVTQTRSLVDKGYDDSHIGGQLVDALIEAPTATEDGFVITWNDTNQEYELVAGGGGGGWELTGTTTLTGAVDVQGGANEIKLSGSALVAGVVQVDSWLSIDNNDQGTHSIELKNQNVGAGTDSLGGLRINQSNFSFLEFTDNNDATNNSFVEVYSGNILFSVNDDRVTFDGVKMYYNQTPTITVANDIISKGYADAAYWKTSGTTTITADVLITDGGTAGLRQQFKSRWTDFESTLTIDTSTITSSVYDYNLSKGAGIVIAATGYTGIEVNDDISSVGFYYADDYTTAGISKGARWITDKGYSDNYIGGQLVDALIVSPTITQDGFVIAWNNTNDEYELIAAGGGGGWAVTGYTTLTGITTIDADNNLLQFRGDDSNSSSSTLTIQTAGITTAYTTGGSQRNIAVNSSGILISDAINSEGAGYAGDFSTNGIISHGAQWITDKGYDDSHIGGQLVDALIEAPTATEDGYVVSWNDTNNEYELVAGGGGGLGAGSGLTENTGNIDLGGNLTSDADIIFNSNHLYMDGDGGWRVRVTTGGAINQIQMSSGGGGFYVDHGGAGAQQLNFNSTFIRITDTTNNKGLEYGADYSANFFGLSVTDKNYQDGHIGGQLVDALVESPTATEDGYVVSWNDTNNEYELVAGGGGTYWDIESSSNSTSVYTRLIGDGSNIVINAQKVSDATNFNSASIQTVAVQFLQYRRYDGAANGSQWNSYIKLNNSLGSDLSSLGLMLYGWDGTSLGYKGFTLQAENGGTVGAKDAVFRDSYDERGLEYDADYSSNGITEAGDRWIPDVGYTDSVYVPFDGNVGFYGETPVSQPAHIADATNATDVILRLNDLLAQMATLGLQAAS